jgi:HK97 family phage major capsid protein
MAAKPENRDQRIEQLLEKADRDENVTINRASLSSGVVSTFESTPAPGVMNRSELDLVRGSAMKRNRVFRQIDDLYRTGYQPELKSMSQFLRGVAAPKESVEGKRFRGMHDATVESLRKSYMSQFNGLTEAEVKAVGLNTFDADGAGALVTPEFSNSIIERSFSNDLWERTDGYTVGGNSIEFPKSRDTDRREGKRSGGIGHAWTGEEKLLSSYKPGVDQIALKLKKLGIVIFVTQELLDDSGFALEQWFSRKVQEEINFALGNAIFRGTGANQPMGFLNSPSLITVAKESGQAAATVVTANILKMWSHRVAGADSNYIWVINKEVETQLTILSAGGNNELVYMPAGGLSGAAYATLRGRPVITSEFAEGLGTVGDISLIDLSQYITIGKGGVTESVSSHVEFLRDQIAYKYTIRVDGRPCDDAPIQPFKGTTLESSYIVLATRG